tara:strand:- start:1020 stop:2471 length:1452 start_codon:yes stop_codon:yes gene_type:complete
MFLTDIKLFSSEISLIFGALFILLYGIFFNKSENLNKGILYITFISLITSFYLAIFFFEDNTFLFNNLLINNSFILFFKCLIFFGTIVIVLFSYNYLNDLKILKPEYFFLILLSLVGILILISSNNLLSMYLGLELQSICLYVLASYRISSIKSSESGVKYFILGALSSGILLYGISIIYAFTNETNFIEISKLINFSLENKENFLIINIGFILILCGLFFKIAVVPFHMWAPDVYEGSPTSITAFFTTIPKIGAVAFLVRFLNIPFESYYDIWFQILYIVSIASMILGSIAAINQLNIKRLLAYSSISHLGFLLIGVLTANQIGIKSIQLYLFIYLFNLLGVFICLLSLKNKKNGFFLEDIRNFSGLLKKNSFLSISLAIFLFSLAGLPPLSGFFGKLYILISAVESKLYFLAIIGILTSIISVFYYLKIIKYIFFDKSVNSIYIQTSFIYNFFICMSLLVSIFLIIFLSDFLEILNTSSIF